MLITTITFCQIKVDNLDSYLKNKKYGEKDERQACQLNLHPIVSHGNYKSQFWVSPLWRPYFHKPCFTICTIHSTNPYALGWSCEVVR
jgi:hypothetical protein